MMLSRHHDRRAKPDASIEVEDVRIVHADAAVGDLAPDRAGIVGAVDGVLAGAERERGCAHGIAAAAAGDHIRQVRLVVPHFGWRGPRRMQILAADDGGAGPLLAGAADAHRVAYRPPVAQHVIKRPLAGLHHHRAGHVSPGKSDNVASLRALRNRGSRGKHERRRSGCTVAWSSPVPIAPTLRPGVRSRASIIEAGRDLSQNYASRVTGRLKSGALCRARHRKASVSKAHYRFKGG